MEPENSNFRSELLPFGLSVHPEYSAPVASCWLNPSSSAGSFVVLNNTYVAFHFIGVVNPYIGFPFLLNYHAGFYITYQIESQHNFSPVPTFWETINSVVYLLNSNLAIKKD